MAVESSTEINLGKEDEIRIAQTSTGAACTTTAKFEQFPLWTSRVIATPRSFSTAVVVKVAFNPWLTVLKTTDNMITLPTDYSEAAQDASTSTLVDVSELNTRANGDFLLIGSHKKFRGVYFDVYGLNAAGTATVAIYYWNGSAWTNTSATVTGIRTTMVWDKDGIVTWTVQSAWQPATIRDLYSTMTADAYYKDVPLYWTRWEVDVALADTDVTFYHMYAASRSTSYGEVCSGQRISKDINHGFLGDGCIECLTDANGANLVVNCIAKGAFE